MIRKLILYSSVFSNKSYPPLISAIEELKAPVVAIPLL
jgi:hypothetical protein